MAFQSSIDRRRDHLAVSTSVGVVFPLDMFLGVVNIKEFFHLASPFPSY